MGESVTSLEVLIQQHLPYHIMRTDAVQIATLVDPSEQQEKYDSLFSHTGKCERNSLINNDH